MKKQIITLAIAIAFASCGGSKQNPQSTTTNAADSQPAATQPAQPAVTEDFINQRIKEVVRYIPDHGIQEGSEAYITPEFFAMLKKAYDLPPQETDGIDEASEFLYYFIEGNGDCAASMAEGVYNPETDEFDSEKFYANHQFANFHTKIDGDKATSTFDYIHGSPDQTAQHTITLKNVNGQWLIDDWNDARKEVKAYLDNYGKK